MAEHELSEEELQQRVLQTARLYGWRAAHFRPAQTAKGWRTPMSGDPGFPDLVLARDGVVLFAELKSRRGRTTPDQDLWLDQLGDHSVLWRPADWPAIQNELRRTP
ncbi:VRR-NUC domain-containing protein [Amycolatopsis sp. NPDC004378]